MVNAFTGFFLSAFDDSLGSWGLRSISLGLNQVNHSSNLLILQGNDEKKTLRNMMVTV